jgi:hypothetical protein
MRRSSWIALLIVATLVAAGIVYWPRLEQKLLELHGVRPASASVAKRSPKEEGWPDTNAGSIGRQWVAAYDSGEVAMRGFYARAMSAESLAKKPPEARLESYRKLRERIGKLMLASVVDSRDTMLVVSLLAEDGVPREFTFTLEGKPPHKLLSVSMLDVQHGGHGGGGHGHP